MTHTKRKSLACFKNNFQHFQNFLDRDKYFFWNTYLILVWDWITIQKCLKNVEYFEGSGKGLDNGVK